MAITFGGLLKVAHRANALAEMRSVVFDGKSAMTANEMDWVVGVPCLQANITEPVVVPAAAIMAHMAKSRHLVVMPDHLSNGQGLTTPFNKPKNWVDQIALDMLPPLPTTAAVTFDLELDALDRVLIAAAQEDIRYYLKGVLFDLSNGMLVGTNGHQLHCYRNRVPAAYPMKLKNGNCRAGGPVEVILHRDPLKWLLHSAGQFAKVTVFNPLREKVDGVPALPGVLLQTDDTFVWIKKPIEGKFPDYARVIPAVLTRPVWLEIDPVKLADTLGTMRRVLKESGAKDTYGMVVDFGKGEVSGGVGCPDAGVLPFTVNLSTDDPLVNLAGVSDDLWVGIHSEYLQDLADCVTPAAQWRVDHVNMENQSLLVVDGDFSGVVMPCRVGGPVKAAKPEPVAMPEAAQVAAVEPEPVTVPEPQEEPEEAPPEPCPAAVAAIAAQLVTQAQESAKKAPGKAQKAKKGPTVGEYIIKAVKDEPVTA